jgi:hypothetical protein
MCGKWHTYLSESQSHEMVIKVKKKTLCIWCIVKEVGWSEGNIHFRIVAGTLGFCINDLSYVMTILRYCRRILIVLIHIIS